MEKKINTHNNAYSKGGVSCFADIFVQAQSLVHQMKFCVESPVLRLPAKH